MDNEEPVGDPGFSLRTELAGLRNDVQQLTKAVRSLVQLQSVMDQKLTTVLKGGVGADFGVI